MPLQHLHLSCRMRDVVDERGMQAWSSPRVHCPCSGVCKTASPGGRGVCASQARRCSQALPGRLHLLWEPTHSRERPGKRGVQRGVASGRGAAAFGRAAGAPGRSAVDSGTPLSQGGHIQVPGLIRASGGNPHLHPGNRKLSAGGIDASVVLGLKGGEAAHLLDEEHHPLWREMAWA